MTNEVVADTSALVEYVFGTEKGKAVKEIIEHQENSILIASIAIGELVSKLESCSVKNVDELISTLETFAVILPIDKETCAKAGKMHASLKKTEKSISLVDCIIMVIAEQHGNAMVITTDRHFRHYKNAKII